MIFKYIQSKLTKLSMDFLTTFVSFFSFDAGPGRDKSLMSLTAASMPCDTSSTSASNIPEEEPEDLAKLTFAQLSLIQLTWQAVIIDSANLCLNFFMDINRMFPVKRKNSNSSNESGSTFKATGRSLMSRITSSQVQRYS